MVFAGFCLACDCLVRKEGSVLYCDYLARELSGVDWLFCSSFDINKSALDKTYKMASAQSDQSLRCPHEISLGPTLPTERTVKTLIRLGRCPG